MKELKDLLVGDEVVVTYNYGRRVEKVVRTTKLLIIVESGTRFRKDTGDEYRSCCYHPVYINVATEKLKAEVKAENIRKKMVNKLLGYDFRKLPTDKLRQVYDIIEEVEPKNKEQ